MVCSCDVPQGFILGPIPLTTFISSVANVVESFDVSERQYADDTQLYIEPAATTLGTAVKKIEDRIAALQFWFTHNGLASKKIYCCRRPVAPSA